jgi:hypothetical protein
MLTEGRQRGKGGVERRKGVEGRKIFREGKY